MCGNSPGDVSFPRMNERNLSSLLLLLPAVLGCMHVYTWYIMYPRDSLTYHIRITLGVTFSTTTTKKKAIREQQGAAVVEDRMGWY